MENIRHGFPNPVGTSGFGSEFSERVLRVTRVEVPWWLNIEHALAGWGIVFEITVPGVGIDDRGWDAGWRRRWRWGHDTGACGADSGGEIGAEGAISRDGGGGLLGFGIGCAEGGGFSWGSCECPETVITVACCCGETQERGEEEEVGELHGVLSFALCAAAGLGIEEAMMRLSLYTGDRSLETVESRIACRS